MSTPPPVTDPAEALALASLLERCRYGVPRALVRTICRTILNSHTFRVIGPHRDVCRAVEDALRTGVTGDPTDPDGEDTDEWRGAVLAGSRLRILARALEDDQQAAA